jgi:hypothetical protein
MVPEIALVASQADRDTGGKGIRAELGKTHET